MYRSQCTAVKELTAVSGRKRPSSAERVGSNRSVTASAVIDTAEPVRKYISILTGCEKRLKSTVVSACVIRSEHDIITLSSRPALMLTATARMGAMPTISLRTGFFIKR